MPYQNASNNIRQANDASAQSFAIFAQDAWKATSRWKVSFRLRYEFHPALASTNGLDGNFTPLGRTGQLIFPAGHATAIDIQELANGNACATAGITNGSQPIGSFGTQSIGDPPGPETVNLSAGVSKAIRLHERLSLRGQATFTNAIDHTNLADPTLDLTQASFNKISAARGFDFGGNRTGQVSVRLEF